MVPKANGKVRICVDLTKLNESVLRERHPLPCVDYTLAQLAGANIFSKLDANSGIWQISLSPESRPLTTFITPFGRFWFNSLPLGVASAPEHFQKRMSQVSEQCEGVLCKMDDVLVHGPDQATHDERLFKAMEKLESAGLTLNPDKYEFSKPKMTYLGNLVEGNGIKPDLEKIEAIIKMQPPNDRTELRRFLGMTNQMGKFTPNLAEKTKPMRELLSTKNQWIWEAEQERSFLEVKKELSSTPTLALYSTDHETTISADASSYGLGAVLTQRQADSCWRPVAYDSRAMTEAEQRYAQVEKEALAVTWACEKFADYIIGKKFKLKTDHIPLIPLLGSMSLASLPPRIQRFRMRLMRMTY